MKTNAPSELRSRAAPIIERAPLPLVEVQGNAHFVSYVNSAFCTLIGKNRNELIGKTFAEIVHGGDECVPILDRVYQTSKLPVISKKQRIDGVTFQPSMKLLRIEE
jgi:PAS domain S-box-containing protein